MNSEEKAKRFKDSKDSQKEKMFTNFIKESKKTNSDDVRSSSRISNVNIKIKDDPEFCLLNEAE